MLWRALAGGALLLGFIGIVVPGLPTVPFLLVAAWAGGKGWPALEARLLAHPRYGPVISRWRDHGAIPRRAKWLASGMMLLSASVLWFTALPLLARVAIPLFMLAVAVWMWRRPEL
ncbi:MAG: YbaN family protein [Rubrivivax sp.]|nr:YbaN family protein [Rubrivivax sp.]